ncbi:toll-like receptor 3 [Aplochiton taeniatus]
MNLKEIPPDLPRDIYSLDMSHNRLGKLLPAALSLYPGLLHLDVSYNSISVLEEGVCQSLILLKTLIMQHNVVHLLMEKNLKHCSNLTVLILASNKLKLQGEPFMALQSLMVLDVSRNHLTSVKLGSLPQLPSLVTLALSNNDVAALKTDDFSFLIRSPSLRFLNLTYLPLKSIEHGSFKPIAGIHTLTMDGTPLSPPLMSNLSLELSWTAITSLSLQKTSLVTISNSTFKGLESTNLTSLDLSYNSMANIGNGSFQWLPKLESLYLEENILKHLTKITFQGLSSLKNLNLRRALVKSHSSSSPIIEDFSFQSLGRLKNLNMEHTAFREITKNTFSGLISLRQLYLGWSSCLTLRSITNTTLVSLSAAPLTLLNLTATAISSLASGAFSSLGNLTTLLLGHNFIRQTLTGEEFKGLGRVQEIYLSNNDQKIILSSTSFIHVPSLRSLMLGKAVTGTLDLDPSPFRPLSNLTFLDLSNNNIANLNSGLLDGLVHLQVLNLQHNNLARLWKSANPGGPALFLRELQSLVVLNMDNTGLDEIPTEALSNLTNLRELSLNNNLLNRLTGSVFEGPGSLQVLRLQKNVITGVRKEVFEPAMVHLKELVMDKNPFDCTCESILWFVGWLNQTAASVPGLTDMYMCNTPPAYFNRSIMNFDPLSCKDMTPFHALYIFSSTAVLSLMVGAFLVRFQGWRIQFYWNILVSRTLGMSDKRTDEGRAFEYDAYVIYAKEDEDWVERSLIPIEKEQCLLCLEDRDSVAGRSQLESIVDNMRNSRKYVFVVSERLLRDPWCIHFKAHHALHQVIEANRDSVILIFLQEVQDYRLARALLIRRGMLRSHCILHWPQHHERVPAFHQNLRIALGTTNRLSH